MVPFIHKPKCFSSCIYYFFSLNLAPKNMRTRCVETEKCKLSFDNCNNTCNTSEDKKSHICYNHVQNNTKTGQLEVKWAGCLSTCTEDKTKISHNECNLYFHSTKEENHSYFCCCTGDLCNRNIKLNETNMMPPPTPPSCKY